MVSYEKKKVIPIDDRPVMEKLRATFGDKDDAFITLCLMYANGYESFGVNVVDDLTRAFQNTQFLESVYKRGYEDCLADVKNNKYKDFQHKVLRDLK